MTPAISSAASTPALRLDEGDEVRPTVDDRGGRGDHAGVFGDGKHDHLSAERKHGVELLAVGAVERVRAREQSSPAQHLAHPGQVVDLVIRQPGAPIRLAHRLAHTLEVAPDAVYAGASASAAIAMSAVQRIIDSRPRAR